MQKRKLRSEMGLLNTLQLDHNSIVKLEPGAFSDVRNLETVTLNKNGIPGMDGNQFFFIRNMKIRV